MSALETIEVLGLYRVDQRHGFNGSTATFEAVSTSDGTRVAIVGIDASMLQSSAIWDKVEQYLDTLAKAELHNRVARPVSWGLDAGVYWVAYEWLTGSHLGGIVQAEGLPLIARSFEIAAQVVEGLEILTGLDIPHLCISPASIFICQDGSVRILHAGWSHMLLHCVDGPAHPNLMSNLPFLAPEVAGMKSGQSFEADVFSVASNLFFLFTGQPTHWTDDPVHLAQAIATVRPVMMPLQNALDEEAAELMEEMLEMDPEDRPVNLAALRDRLSANSARFYEAMNNPTSEIEKPDVMGGEVSESMGGYASTDEMPTPRPSAMHPVADEESSRSRNALQAAVADGLARQQAGESLTGKPKATPSPTLTTTTAPAQSGGSNKGLIAIVVVGGLIVCLGIAGAAVMIFGGGSPPPEPPPTASTQRPARGGTAADQPARPRGDEAYRITQTRLLTVAELMRNYRRDYGIWPRNVGELALRPSDEIDTLEDAWGNPFDLRDAFAVSSGADSNWDTNDDVWINAENRELGGRVVAE